MNFFVAFAAFFPIPEIHRATDERTCWTPPVPSARARCILRFDSLCEAARPCEILLFVTERESHFMIPIRKESATTPHVPSAKEHVLIRKVSDWRLVLYGA